MKRYRIRVQGAVQGIFYRQSAAEQARRFGLTGFARNEDDGAVAIEAQGEEAALARFLDWCRNGPDLAKVAAVEAADIPPLEAERGFVVQ